MPAPFVHFTPAQEEAFMAKLATAHNTTVLYQMLVEEENALIDKCYRYHATWCLADIEQKRSIWQIEREEALDTQGDTKKMDEAIAELDAEARAILEETISRDEPYSEWLEVYNRDLKHLQDALWRLFEPSFIERIEAVVEEVKLHQLPLDARTMVERLLTQSPSEIATSILTLFEKPALASSTNDLLAQLLSSLKQEYPRLNPKLCDRLWKKHALWPLREVFIEQLVRGLNERLEEPGLDIKYKDVLWQTTTLLLASLEAADILGEDTCPHTEEVLNERITRGNTCIGHFAVAGAGNISELKQALGALGYAQQLYMGYAVLSIVPIVITAALPFALGLSFSLSMISLIAFALSLISGVYALGQSFHYQREKERLPEEIRAIYNKAVDAARYEVDSVLAVKHRFFPSAAEVEADLLIRSEDVFDEEERMDWSNFTGDRP